MQINDDTTRHSIQMRCRQFGFDQKKIKQRLTFLHLSSADHQLARRLNQEVIQPHLEQIVEHFYEGLLFHAESRKWLLDGETIDRLKQTQKAYLLSLGIDFDHENYFENRLQIGVMHATIDLPLHVYQGAYSNLIRYIIDAIPEQIQQNIQVYHALTNFIIKITSLDMSLAIETYHNSNIAELNDEIKIAHTRHNTLLKQAEIDPLTGLYNRKYAFNYLNKAIADAHLYSGQFSLLMLDIDHFKKVNDTYGHQGGDIVLKVVANRISKTLRDNDIVGRYGGEEFILGLLDVPSNLALRIADRIRSLVANDPICVDEQRVTVTISIGLTSLGENDNLSNLITRADKALYDAKESGRNRVELL